MDSNPIKTRTISSSILDKPFNMAGVFRGFFLGLICGFLVLGIVVIGTDWITGQTIYNDLECYTITFLTLVWTIVLAVRGAREAPRVISERITQWSKLSRMFTIRESIIPESITLRKFFKDVLIFLGLAIVIVGIAILVAWLKGLQ